MSVVMMMVLAGPASQPLTQPPTKGSGEVRELLAQVQKEFSGCEKGECDSFGADVWALRKRVATTEELRSMAVQSEQGDESCLCGVKTPTVVAIDRQAHLLAEAALLYHLCGDGEGAMFCLTRLRNVAAKEPSNLGVAELLVRTSALLNGAEAGVREAAGISPAETRGRVLIAASETAGLENSVRDGLLKAVGDVGTANQLAMVRALERAGDSEGADAFVDAQPAAERGKLRMALFKLRRERTEKTPDPAALSKALASTDAIAIEHAAETSGGELSVEKVKQIAASLPGGAPRVGFLVGAMRGMTKGTDRVRYEDFLVMHAESR